MAPTPNTGWNSGRPFNVAGLSRDNATSQAVDPGLVARISGSVRSWLKIDQANGGRELPFFPPGQPLPPMAPGAVGRAFDYPMNVNANIRARSFEAIDFDTLRAVAEPGLGGWDLVRLAIETRKDQMANLTFSVLPRKPANATLRPKSTPQCQQIEEFLRRPDGQHSWADWVRMLTEEHLVIDAPTIYNRPSLSGGVAKLEILDGSLIKPVLAYDGRRPASGPAYVQNLKGMPAVHYTPDEIIYAPRNPRAHKSYGYCYTPDHEVLTRRGWLPFTAVALEDEIATRNSVTKAFEWQRPSRLVTMSHRGEVYRLHSTSVDLMVTPDHNVLLDSMPKGASGDQRRTKGQGGDALVPAKLIALGHNPMNKIPMTSVWRGIAIGEKTFALAEPEGTIEVTRTYADGRGEQTFTRLGHRGNEKPLTMSGDDYCALMGAYVAEGNLRSQGGLEINQFPTSKGYGPYAQLISRVTGAPASHTGRAFILARKGLTEHFAELGLQPERYIPDEVMNASASQLRLFWDYFVLGDGSFEARKSMSGRGRVGDSRMRITTTSTRLADQLMEIAQKLGWSASKRHRKGGPVKILGKDCIAKDSYVVSVRYSKAMGFKLEESWYEGDVHCVTVPNGVIYVRRNGKPAWCGNSPVEQVIVTINIGLRRQVSQLGFYTEGNVPDAVAQVPADWSIQKIAEWQDYWDTIVNDAVRRRKMKFIPGGMQFQPTRNDQALVDAFDEWLARVVQYCFSLPPTPLVRMMNRATSESAYESALDEGLQPLMIWLKGIMDDIITRWFKAADLEFVFDDVKKTDPAEKEERDAALVQQGVISRDDMRSDRGLEPLGIPAVVSGIGPLGFMSVSAMIKAINNGWDLTGMPQPGPGAPGDLLAGASPSSIGTGEDDDPLKDMPPEVLEALGIGAPPSTAGGSPRQPKLLANNSRPESGVPIHQHPMVQQTLREGQAQAKRAAARMSAK